MMHTLKIKLSKIDENTRAHVFGFTYLPNIAAEGFNSLSSISNSDLKTEIFPFTCWENVFQSCRKMGDEYQYVFNRKMQKRFIGNTLERPQLIMKRLKVRDTNFDTEELNDGSNYQEVCANKPFSVFHPSSHHSHLRSFIENDNCIYSFQNFLKTAAIVYKNVHPSTDGTISIDLDSSNYSSFIILATNTVSSTQVLIDIPFSSKEIEKRDLTCESLDCNKYFNEVRNTVLVQSKNKFSIQDITSTQYIFIDSISKVKQICDDLCIIKSTQIDKSLSFLIKWNTLSRAEKDRKYNEFQCHEVNLFLYFKDKEYFIEVAQPFICSKMEKTFIDHWLLEEYEEILHYQTIGHFDKLNALEQCLLTFAVFHNDVKAAKILFSRIKLSSDSNTKNIPVDIKNRMFDTVLSLNSLQKNTDKINYIQEAANKIKLNSQYIQNEILCENFDLCDFSEFQHPTPQMCLSKNTLICDDPFGDFFDSTPNANPKSGKIQQESANFTFKNAPTKQLNFNEENLFEERQQVRSQFQELEKASEYCETHYFQNIKLRDPNLIKANRFWEELAEHILSEGRIQGFISSSFIYATNSTTELMSMLALLELPFEEQNHSISIEGNKGIQVTASSNMIVFKKEIKEAVADIDTNLLSIHRFFEHTNSNSKKKLTEFLTHKVYTCEVVITNVSIEHQNFQVLWQIPEGSIPVLNTTYQKTEVKQLGPYTTMTFKFDFYFPKTGKFVQFPTNITINDKVVATAKTCNFNVVDELTEITFETFSDYIQSGDFPKICEFLETSNLIDGEKGFNFNNILWLLKDKQNFDKIIDILRNRLIFDYNIWSYGFLHKNSQVIKEFIQRNIINFYGNQITFSYNLETPSGEYKKFRHLDYYPLINARAHQLVDDKTLGILNVEFRETYNKFLFSLARKTNLDIEDKLNWTLYYLLQDKTAEAIKMFELTDGTILKEKGTMRIQYDYLAAYLNFYTGMSSNFKIAREISSKYTNYPVLYWNGLFREIREQLQEFDGVLHLHQEINQKDELQKTENLKISKNLAPQMECKLDGKKIVIDYLNISKIDIKYYVIDPELMFSKSPFLTLKTDEFSYIKPLKVDSVDLSQDLTRKTVEVDKDYVSNNLIIEIQGDGKQIFLSYFSTDLHVIVNEEFGELKVTDPEGNPLPKVYVKVYSKQFNREVKFFRDGYTDIRGRFEYSQCSSGKLELIEKFSIFIMSDELGSLTKELKPPKNIKKYEF